MSQMKILEIEDTSDCQTCTQRNKDEWEMLAAVKCGILENLTCPECFRTITIFVEAISLDSGYDDF